MANKFWKKKRDPVNLSELMEKMAGDFPDYSYYGFVDKFTAGKPLLKQELIKKGYFTYVGNDHYILGPAGIQLVQANKTVDSTDSMERMTFVIVIFTIIIAILTAILVYKELI